MAVKINYLNDFKANTPNAYIRVLSVSENRSFQNGGDAAGGLSVRYAVFADEEARFANAKPIALGVSEFSLGLDRDEPIKAGYRLLKTLPEFAGAVDC